ncbi:hypothetical protein Y919_10575 [Caloranaerobacter azorensis H53214]|uniref:Uncharacterized protein n=1 Tax=Caloranaerobacter azorensis H53214 TaxID=1156417 RepID=A0A096DK75_9FIRM|nr:hypothetical protein [Caloranaerobacter azorensis]KGG79681.1 hypothetical protein Y919_10575 [Caloranaerobacter azorensis H53214]
MNKFDERYIIRLANISDIDNIMRFIDEHWKKGHIMARDKGLFKYEYADGDNLNFVLAIDKNTKLIEGIFGFLKCSNTKDPKKKDIWGSIWKVNDSHNNIPFLGIELAKRVFTLTNCRTHIGNGANPNTTIPLRRLFFGDKGVKMKQYYLLNPYIDEYKIAVVKNKVNEATVFMQNEVTLREFHSIDEIKKYFDIESVDAIPYKDNWYVNKRYFCHPYYKYNVYGLEERTGKIGALMMARVVEYNGRKVFRIVDYIGNQKLFAGLSKEFQEMIKDNGFEYIDFYTYGFDEESILKAGFKLRTDDDPNIIPNYFEPFVRKNIDIWAHYKIDGTLFFKADGDQDRPNIIRSI